MALDSFSYLPYLWLSIGAMLILLEALAIPGVGCLFAGLGAISVGACMVLGWMSSENWIWSFTFFFLFSLAWALVLWIPLKRFSVPSQLTHYSGINGQEVEVIDAPLSKNKVGRVKWSGTIMQAKLVQRAKEDEIPIGAIAKVVSVSGTILIVEPVN